MQRSVFAAVEFAARAHRGQYRKGTRIPYVLHPLRVAGILIERRAPDPVVTAAILHDTVEDTPATLEEVEAEFGSEVATLVEAVSEADRSAPWEHRKQTTIDAIDEIPSAALLIVAADKLDNVRSMRRGEHRDGPDFWDRFHRAKSKQAWYYRGVLDVMRAREPSGPLAALVAELEREVERLFPASGD